MDSWEYHSNNIKDGVLSYWFQLKEIVKSKPENLPEQYRIFFWIIAFLATLYVIFFWIVPILWRAFFKLFMFGLAVVFLYISYKFLRRK